MLNVTHFCCSSKPEFSQNVSYLPSQRFWSLSNILIFLNSTSEAGAFQMSFVEKRRRNINFPLLSLFWISNFKAMSIYLISRLNFKHFIYIPFTFLFPSFPQSSCIFLIFVLSDQIVSTIFFLLKSEKNDVAANSWAQNIFFFKSCYRMSSSCTLAGVSWALSKMSELETFVYIPHLKGIFFSSQCN